MDKTFWQSIIDNDYTVPPGYSIETLTPGLLSLLGSPDHDLREGPAYAILDAWIHRGNYSRPDLWNMATQLLHNLTVGLGEQHSDTIFLRSFSLLILSEIVYYDLTHAVLEETDRYGRGVRSALFVFSGLGKEANRGDACHRHGSF
jgi:hypothetical protein